MLGENHFALPATVRWIEGALLGSVATGVAVLAVAFVGYGMLAGRLDWRTGLRVVLGVFILFGAPLLVRELTGAVRGGEGLRRAWSRADQSRRNRRCRRMHPRMILTRVRGCPLAKFGGSVKCHRNSNF